MSQVFVYARNVQWDVVVPFELVWRFMRAFGEKFRVHDSIEETRFIRPVDGYYEHPAGWHIQVSVEASEEPALEQFCTEFCASEGVDFRKTGTTEFSCDAVSVGDALQGMEGRKVRLVLKIGGDVEGIFSGLQLSCAVICSDSDILPYRLDSIERVILL